MRIRPSALKHGVAAEDVEQAAEWALWIEPLDDAPPVRELRLGFDTSARLLETVVLVFEAGEEMVDDDARTLVGFDGREVNSRGAWRPWLAGVLRCFG